MVETVTEPVTTHRHSSNLGTQTHYHRSIIMRSAVWYHITQEWGIDISSLSLPPECKEAPAEPQSDGVRCHPPGDALCSTLRATQQQQPTGTDNGPQK